VGGGGGEGRKWEAPPPPPSGDGSLLLPASPVSSSAALQIFLRGEGGRPALPVPPRFGGFGGFSVSGLLAATVRAEPAPGQSR
jgi:hypothetical protein